MNLERWAGVWGPESHKWQAKGLTIYPAFNKEPLQVFEEVSDMARAQMSLPCNMLDYCVYLFITWLRVCYKPSPGLGPGKDTERVRHGSHPPGAHRHV